MMRLLKICIGALCLLSSCINDDPVKGADLKVGERIPDFSVMMNDGSTLTSADLGKGVSVIVFFHTGCPDCARTLPVIQSIHDAYKDDNVVFALISREEGSDTIGRFWKENAMTLPYSAQSTREIYELFASSRIPRVYICLDGTIKALFTDDPTPSYQDVDSVLKELI